MKKSKEPTEFEQSVDAAYSILDIMYRGGKYSWIEMGKVKKMLDLIDKEMGWE